MILMVPAACDTKKGHISAKLAPFIRIFEQIKSLFGTLGHSQLFCMQFCPTQQVFFVTSHPKPSTSRKFREQRTDFLERDAALEELS